MTELKKPDTGQTWVMHEDVLAKKTFWGGKENDLSQMRNGNGQLALSELRISGDRK